MKRIIELSENDYIGLKEDGVQNHLALADTVIANSVPYEERSQVEPEKIYLAKITFDKEQLQEIVDKAKAEVLASIKRSQGEWIYGEDECGQDGWFCSECGFFVPWYYLYYKNDINFIREYKVCPHCLAEMVTYTGKDRDTKGGAE